MILIKRYPSIYLKHQNVLSLCRGGVEVLHRLFHVEPIHPLYETLPYYSPYGMSVSKDVTIQFQNHNPNVKGIEVVHVSHGV